MNLRERPRIDLSRLNKILLLRLRRIGDIIMTTPAITALKEALPSASLDYVVEAPYRDLVEGHPALDEVIVLPRKQGRREFFQSARRIRRRGYDAVLDFHGGPRASWLTFLSGGGLKIGYRTRFKNYIYDIKIDRAPEGGPVHSVVNHVNLVRALGISIGEIPPLSLAPPTEEETKRIESLISDHGLQDKRLVVLHIGAGNAFRDWGEDNLSSLIGLLGAHAELRVILVGDSGDLSRGKRLQTRGTPPPLCLVDSVNLRELRRLIDKASLFVGPDSGPMHVAASTRTPLVIIFGPTLPAHFAPWRADAVLLETPLDCRPCRQRQCLTENYRCLMDITPRRVYDACLKQLGGSPQ